MSVLRLESKHIVFSLGVLCVCLLYGVLNNGNFCGLAKEPTVDQNSVNVARSNETLSIPEDTVSVRQFGAKGDGITDDTAAFVAAISSGKAVYVPTGNYRINKVITLANDLIMYGDGNGSVLDWSDSVLTGHAFNITGSFTQIAQIKDASIGDNKIVFTSEHGLKISDVFCIANPTDYSWSLRRPYYRAGEMCEVVGVDGLTVFVSDKLNDSYKGADVNAYRMNSRNVVLRNFKVKAETPFDAHSAQLLHIYACKNPVVENITAENVTGGYSTIVFQKCFGVRGTNLHVYLRGTNSNDHGLSINNCQRVLVEGGSFYGRRHGIAIGGTGGEDGWSVINRDVKIVNATISSLDQYSADMHGCSEYVEYDGCKIQNGADFSGSNNSYINCEITSRQNGVCIYGAEILGGAMRIENCFLKSTANPRLVKRGFIDFGGNSNAISKKVKRDLTIVIKNCKLDLKNVYAPGSHFIRLVNRGAEKIINFDISEFTLLNSTQKHIVLSIAKTADSIPDKSDYIVVTDITGLSQGSVLLERENGYLKSTNARLQEPK